MAACSTIRIDHTIGTVAQRGGPNQAAARLSTFIDQLLPRYATDRNQPELDATSRLSPYLHFGHISAHQVFDRIVAHESWTSTRLADNAAGRRAAWWGMSENAEAFLDQLVTWRELGFNRCVHVPGYGTFEALPAWARTTLAEHASDARNPTYELDDFEQARTHDPLWNAAQNQLRREGHIVLGLHDRPWGPERPVFGKVRYMSSANTARKYRVRRYIKEYSAP